MTIGQAGSIAARAAIIYADARSAVDGRLWQAALGTPGTGRAFDASPTPAPGGTELGFESLLAIIGNPPRPDAPRPASAFGLPRSAPAAPAAHAAAIAASAAHAAAISAPAAHAAAIYAPAAHAAAIAVAAERTGVPAAALAAIIGAEAAPDGYGGWLATSRNPRSSAAGLGQFLGGTWLSEAARAGTWLNRTAHANGWIGSDGRVLPGARAALLALRDEPRAAIEATADYAGQSLRRLASAGVAIGQGIEAIAEAAYIGHNLGAGDAVRFLGAGLGEARARQLLGAQVGEAAARRRIAAAGGAEAAHRSWLNDFIDRRVRPA